MGESIKGVPDLLKGTSSRGNLFSREVFCSNSFAVYLFVNVLYPIGLLFCLYLFLSLDFVFFCFCNQ